jgi:hypothetical protein
MMSAPRARDEIEHRRLQILACVGPPGLATFMTMPEPGWAKPPAEEIEESIADGQEELDSITGAAAFLKPERPRNRFGMDYCVHEAGHALAHWYVGVPFSEVSVGPAGEAAVSPDSAFVADAMLTGFDLVPQRRNWLALAESGDASALARGRIATEMEMFCAYAGPFAQARYPQTYRVQREGERPIRRSSRLDVGTILYFGGGEADWSLIETDIADWPEGVAMAARACRLADAFVRGRLPWAAITEVARCLSVDLRLTWGEVAAIAERHLGRPAPQRDDWLPHWPPLTAAVRGGFLPPTPADGGSIADARCGPLFKPAVEPTAHRATLESRRDD